jgi:hypothetical protein
LDFPENTPATAPKMLRLRPAYVVAERVSFTIPLRGALLFHTLALALVVCSRLSIVPDRVDGATSSEDFLDTAEEDIIVEDRNL